MTQSETVQSFYKRLSKHGYTKPYLQRNIFPEWWKDSAAVDKPSFYELKMVVAKRLGLDFSSLLNPELDISVLTEKNYHFKGNTDTSEQTIALATTLASIISSAMRLPYKELPESALQIREEIISSSKTPWVGFDELVDYLWAQGIPVLFLAQIHTKWKKMDGMVTISNGRPVILLSKNELSCAWQLFILAHEVGHIVKGHLKQNQSITDSKIDKLDTDPKEQEANHTAIELITADRDTCFTSASGRWLNPTALAKSALEYGKKNHIDPGHIVLNYGNSTKQMAVARSALKLIEPSSNAPSLLGRKLIENIDASLLPEDTYAYLLNMCGMSE